MAFVAVSLGSKRLACQGITGCTNRVLGSAGAGKIKHHQQVAGIYSPASYRPKTEKPAAWPYLNKKFTVLDQILWDSTEDRLDENSKVIVVDGNLALGKTQLAKKLASTLDFHYVPPVMEKDMFYSDEYEMDLRRLNHTVAKFAQYYDLRSWLTEKHPENGCGARLQMDFYKYRVQSYALALHHLLSTGQGVVLERSPFSDQIFPDAMLACGFMRRPAHKYYLEFKRQTVFDMWKPHVTIYIDAPVSLVMDNIKRRDLPEERGSKVLTEKFVNEIDLSYKKNVLPLMKKYGEVLVYDAADMDEVDVVVEDLERLNLDFDPESEDRFRQWTENRREDLLSYFRRYFGSRTEVNKLFNLPQPWHCPEMMDSGDVSFERGKALSRLESSEFAKGYNPKVDDMWQILLK